jgi:hypothetical protein
MRAGAGLGECAGTGGLRRSKGGWDGGCCDSARGKTDAGEGELLCCVWGWGEGGSFLEKRVGSMGAEREMIFR